ncbi:hypothetical protein JRQ81_006014 [Phrynocephalus forsythii]|uniref:Leukosialin n=1 Tax=Phrynocephalus forsythii TaxID=171643 RepID=A0A9Q0XK69_9SAUR|nr:hypothetical protein JRQ81_006014 [Phrynocephalus forsythii]
MATPVGGENVIVEANNDTLSSTATPEYIKTTLQEDYAPSLLPSATTNSSPSISIPKGVDSTADVSPQHHPSPTAAPLASKGEETVAEALVSSTTMYLSTPKHISDDLGTTITASYTQDTVGHAITSTKKLSLTTAVKVKAFPGAATTVTTILGSTFSLNLSEMTRRTEKETEISATPRQHVPRYHETTSNSIHVRGATHTKGPELGSSEPQSSGKSHLGIILAVVVLVLLIVVIIAFLLCRHQRRSGSTNFSAAGWAGQVALPDDSGMDRDIEQGPVTGPAGEGETRRNTLVTFFGKRQSRLPSVAMEDISGKDEKDECQQLLDGDAGTVCPPEDAGEANGKLAEPSIQYS